jgi:hypothetical protein
MPDEQNPERSNADENDPPEQDPSRSESGELENDAPSADASPKPGNAAPSEAAGTSEAESWLASDRVQAIANVLTVVVALAAIGLSVWQGYESRMSNRLAVVPNLDPSSTTTGLTPSIESEYFPMVSDLGIDSVGVVSYTLENSGLGPAVIQNFLVFKGGKKIYDAEGEEDANWERGIRRDLEKLPFETVSLLQKPYGPGDMLSAGEVHSFLSVPVSASAFTDTSVFDGFPPLAVRDSVLDQRSFVYCYCSVYGEDCDQVHLGAYPPEADVCEF